MTISGNNPTKKSEMECEPNETGSSFFEVLAIYIVLIQSIQTHSEAH